MQVVPNFHCVYMEIVLGIKTQVHKMLIAVLSKCLDQLFDSHNNN